MGGWDNQCMITKVPVDEATLVILREDDEGRFLPCSLPFTGRRNCDSGGLVLQAPDEHSQHVLPRIMSSINSGLIPVDMRALFSEQFPLDATTQGFEGFTRALYMGQTDRKHLSCEGRRLSFALLEGHIYRALQQSVRLTVARATLSEILGDDEPVRSWYSESAGTFDQAAAQFHAISKWLAARSIAWEPVGGGDQFDEAQSLELLLNAVNRFKTEPIVLAGLLEHARYQFDADATLDDLLDVASR
jgi:hypothetical protein